MDIHLNNLFARFQDQFGSGPGLGPGSGTCLTNVQGVNPSLIKSLYRAAAALYRTSPWKRLRSSHLFGVRVGKDSDWSNRKQPFSCIQFTGGDCGELGFIMFRSESDARKMMGSRETIRVPNIEVLRVTYQVESLMFPSHRKLIKSFSLEVSGSDRFPVIDVARCNSSGGLQFRNPSFEELRFVYAVMRGVSLVHPLLQQDHNAGPKWSRLIVFEPFIETVDVQWTPEMTKANYNGNGNGNCSDLVAVTVSHPPGQGYEERVKPFNSMPCKEEDNYVDLKANYTGSLRRCSVCKKEIDEKLICCDGCQAVVYCNSLCQKNHWKEDHKSLCGLYKAMMEREEELAMKIFKFPCFAKQPCKWLDSLGVHKKGMWRRKCNCYNHCPFGLLPIKDDLFDSWGTLKNGEYPSNLPLKNGISTPILLSSWSEYYNLRFLPFSSPVADILTYPLTVYYILTSLSLTSKSNLLKGKDVIVHYLGPEIELDYMPAFAELNHLLNGTGNIQIVMVGPAVPENLSGTSSCLSKRVRVNLVKGIYQDEACYLPSPHVIVGLDCGLDSYSIWGGALNLIRSMGVSAFFTDRCEISCVNVKQVLRNAGLFITHPVTPNPFRSPVRNHGPSTNFPSYSNCFVLGVNT